MVDMIGCRHPVVNHDTENAETFDALNSALVTDQQQITDVLSILSLIHI